MTDEHDDETSPEVESVDWMGKAFGLAQIGLKVFPADRETRAPLISSKDGGRGFYDATSDDFEMIATWWGIDFPDAVVGVWTGGSGIAAADIDRGKASGKDGFVSMDKAGLKVNETEHYDTPSGGQHHIWRTDRVDLTPQKDATVNGSKVEGLDIRAGGSYIIWWGPVPASRDVFSADIPDWVIDAATADSTFVGEGFSGSVNDWLESIPSGDLPSSRINNLVARIPSDDFGHTEMVEMVWAIVRMGSERETGVKRALDKLREAWLRKPYDTPKNRRDFDLALRGAINKGGRVQNPVPSITQLSKALGRATEAGVGDELKALERKVSETSTEIDMARARREMFKIVADAGLSPSVGLGVVTGSKAFKQSVVSVESAWFGDGEPAFHDKVAADEADEEEQERKALTKIEEEIEAAKRLTTLASESAAFTFLDAAEQALVESKPYEWFGTEYLGWVKGRLKHFNRTYHVGALFAALSVITSPWGKVPLAGAKPMDCNLYIADVGDSSTGKTESWAFGTGLIDAFYGFEHGPIIGDISKLSALALHRALILRDGNPSLIYGDEIQSFFQGVQNSQWQNGILGDVSSHYGGDVSPKITLNDKEISGKRAKTMLTTYLTGIADQMLEAVSLSHWTNGFFYRFLWGFGNPRTATDYEIKMETVATSYTAQFDAWATEFKRVGALQDVMWGAGRLVLWEEDAIKRMEMFKEQMDVETKPSSFYDTVFVNANGRFSDSMMKVATIVAMTEAAEKVTLRHVQIALGFAGPWHKSMVLAVIETAKEPFEREVEKCLIWIRRNAIRQVGKPAFIQRSAVMRAFRPNEIADRLLRQLTEEGWLRKAGDTYELTTEEQD